VATARAATRAAGEGVRTVRNVFTIAGKELRGYFVSPIAYVVLTGFLLLGGWFFYNLLSRFNFVLGLYSAMRNPQALGQINLNQWVVEPLLHNLSVVLVILVPMITMRSFAEEKRTGTYELLMTSPVRTGEILAGKFLGAASFLAVMIGLTSVFALLLWYYGNPGPEGPVMAAGFGGLFLTALTFAAVGLCCSAFTENQIIAAVSGLVACLMLYVIGWPAETVGELPGQVLRYLSITEHFSELVKGVVDTADLGYFVFVMALALFVTHWTVESLRWR
jgi:ABC-2 type transport system permease protein